MTRRPALLGVGGLALVLLACTSPASDEASDELGSGATSETSETSETGESESSESGSPSDLPSEDPGDCEALEQLVDALASAPAADQAQLVDEFERAIAYGEHGFPIVCPGRLGVLHRGNPGDTLSLAGDFNAWQVGVDPLDEVAPGIFVARVDVDAASGLYKLVRGGDEFFADPLARRHGWDEFGEYAQIDALPGRSHHERWPDFDQAIGTLEPRDLTVYVPADAAASDVALPLLVMHDGQNLFAPDALFGGWQVGPTLDAAIDEGSLAPLVVVGIANTSARFDEYTPVSDVLDGVEVGGRADDYAEFVVEGVLPFVVDRYDFVDASPAATGVMGSSLGGLVSLYIGLRHADRFGQVGSMSGTIAWGTFGASNPTIVELWAEAPPLGLRVYLDSGGDEGLGCPDDGSDNYCDNLVFGELLRARGWVDEVDLFQRWDPGAPHNEAAWASRLLPALQAWFPGT
jgi:hypothetical protein